MYVTCIASKDVNANVNVCMCERLRVREKGGGCAERQNEMNVTQRRRR